MNCYSVIYEGGFALANTCMDAAAIAAREVGVHIRGFSSREEAYVYSCRQHVQREYKRNPGIQPVLPRLEDLEEYPVFHKPGFIPYASSWRVFAAVYSPYMAILTSTDAVNKFLDYYPLGSEIQEVSSIMDAQHFVNYYYLQDIFPMGAYITGMIPYCSDIPVNTIIEAPCVEWRKKLGGLPPQLPFAGYLEAAPKRTGEKSK